jgi:hypothetical protein
VSAMTSIPNARQRSCTFVFTGEDHFAPLIDSL